MDFEHEINELKRRVGDLEGAYAVLTGQLRHVHPEVVTLRVETKANFDHSRTAMLNLEHRIDGIGDRLGAMELQIWSLRDDLPALIGDALNSDRNPGRP